MFSEKYAYINFRQHKNNVLNSEEIKKINIVWKNPDFLSQQIKPITKSALFDNIFI